jgi:arylsulfatase A-like enzyme
MTHNPATTASDRPTNVLLVTVDSLRADAVPGYGFGPEFFEETTGETAELTAFDAAFATGPGTSPSFPALLTGTNPASWLSSIAASDISVGQVSTSR